jgi:hypothetical protein
MKQSILRAVDVARYGTYGLAYRLAWSSIIPSVVLAFICVACVKSEKEKMAGPMWRLLLSMCRIKKRLEWKRLRRFEKMSGTKIRRLGF